MTDMRQQESSRWWCKLSLLGALCLPAQAFLQLPLPNRAADVAVVRTSTVRRELARDPGLFRFRAQTSGPRFLLEEEEEGVLDEEEDEETADPWLEYQQDHKPEVLTVSPQEGGQRIDKFLSDRFPEHTRSFLGDLCSDGKVRVNGKEARKSAKLAKGDTVEVILAATTAPLTLEGEDIPLEVLFEDKHMMAVNKPPGLVVHPGAGNWKGTFVNALIYHLEKAGGTLERTSGADMRPGIVHRIDKGTSGVLLAAKTLQAQAALSKAFSERRIEKTYLAVCIGNPGSCVIDVPIARHPQDRQKMAVALHTRDEAALLDENSKVYGAPTVGRVAISVVKTLATDGKLSIVEVKIETGRTHQIRVHLNHHRTPILGDELYGNRQWNVRYKAKDGLDRPMLHAYQLGFSHPVTGEPITVKAPIPPDMLQVMRRIWPQMPDWDDLQDRPMAVSEGEESTDAPKAQVLTAEDVQQLWGEGYDDLI